MTERDVDRGRLLMVVVETTDPLVIAALEAALLAAGIDVRVLVRGADESIELDYENARFAVIALTGESEGGATPVPSTRRALPGTIATLIPGTPVPAGVQDLIYVELDADGAWLSRILMTLDQLDWTA